MSWLLILLQAAATSGPQALDLAALEAQALARHPAIRRASADLDSSRKREGQAGAWNNPTIGGSANEWRPRETPSGTFGGFIEQTITLGGKRSSTRATAERASAVAEATLASTRQQVLGVVRERYYHVVVSEERLAVATRLRTLAAQTATTSQQLFNVGIADQPDVLTAEAELARARAELLAAQSARDAAWRQLGAAVAEPSLAPRALATGIGDALPALVRDAALAQVLAENSGLVEATQAAALARSQMQLERTTTRPDLFVRAEAASNRETAHGITIGPQFGVEVGVTIPLFNRNRNGVAAATSAVAGADAAIDEARLDLESRFAAVFAEYEGARALAEAYRVEILPRAEKAYAMHLAKYQEMVAPYPGVLQAQRTLFEMTQQYLDAIDRAWMASSALRSALAVR